MNADNLNPNHANAGSMMIDEPAPKV